MCRTLVKDLPPNLFDSHGHGRKQAHRFPLDVKNRKAKSVLAEEQERKWDEFRLSLAL